MRVDKPLFLRSLSCVSDETTAPASRANFGDSSFEPTDEQLQALSREAFAHVALQHHAALERLRMGIAELRAAALARLKGVDAGRAGKTP